MLRGKSRGKWRKIAEFEEISMKADAYVSSETTAAGYQFGPIVIDVTSRQVWRNGDIIGMPSKAFDALIYLAAHSDRTVTKDELISAVWKDVSVTEDSLVHSMSALRRALGDDPTRPQLIITVPRRGYRLTGPVRAVSGSHEEVPEDAGGSLAGLDMESTRPLRPLIERWHWPTPWILVSIALVLLVAGRVLLPSRTLPGGKTVLLTQPGPEESTVVSGGILSPDGRSMVFVSRDQKAGLARLYLKQMDSPGLSLMAGTEGASHPFWSPTSDIIGFFANGALRTVDLHQGTSKAIAAVPVCAGGGTWGMSGTILFSDWQTGFYRVNPADGRVIRVTTVDRVAGEISQSLPQFLPDGRHFLFFLHSANVDQTGSYVGSLDSPRRIRVLSRSSSPAIYSSPGYLLYVQDAMLMAERFDASRLEEGGKPTVVARNVSAPNDVDGQMTSASGNLLTFRSGAKMQELAWFGRDGQRAGSIPGGKVLRSPMFSPDQRQLVATDGGPGMWMVDLERNAATRLEGEEGMYPLWSPDGTRIAFQSHNSLTLYVRNIAEPARDQVVVSDNERKILSDWSQAGNYLVYATLNPDTKFDLVMLPMSGDKKPISLLRTPFNESQGRISPDGRWIAYVSDESGAMEVYVQRFPSLGDKRIVSIGGGVEPMWRQDGKELFYLSPGYWIVAVPFEPTDPPLIGQPKPLFRAPVNSSTTRNHYAVTPDGQRFLINVEDQSSYSSPITVMVNWLQSLQTP
jgi:DNA-binding winged helix-turn-helix (wHTH) protein/Tol biopolymer transport system component